MGGDEEMLAQNRGAGQNHACCCFMVSQCRAPSPACLVLSEVSKRMNGIGEGEWQLEVAL